MKMGNERSRTIWKQTMGWALGRHEITVPAGAKIISVAFQYDDSNKVSIWFICDPSAKLEKRHIYQAWTGWGFPKGEVGFINTLQRDGLVAHIFEVSK